MRIEEKYLKLYDGQQIWICDYRANYIITIRNIKPTKVIVCHVALKDYIYFQPVNANNNPNRGKPVKLYDMGGKVPVQAFTEEKECKEQYVKFLEAAKITKIESIKEIEKEMNLIDDFIVLWNK